ncbi:MAG: glycogen synthase GlgA [Kiritimatiellae bacterium]|nr:glycogen synthase GlgA [Kiritimatiellia bacterium]
MKVLFAASEISPYASTGGLADIAKALPDALARLDVEVIRVIPCYRQIMERNRNLRDTQMRLQIPVGLSNHTAEVWLDEVDFPKTYYIRRDEFFDRTFLYGLSTRDYDDNFERFTFFQKAVVALIDTLKIKPDIVHCNDWQTGLLPLFLRHGINGGGRAQSERTVYTIHNLAYQGVYPGSSFPVSNLPFSCYNMYEMEYYNQLNCMKAGIVVSQYATTVSKTYASEIRTSEHGCGLEGVLMDKGDKLIGILNGVDYSEWNPETDRHIAKNYSADDTDGKLTCKADLLQLTGLDPDIERPLIGIVTRLAEQKGLDILAQAIEKIMEHDVSMVILGTGQQKYHDLCTEWSERWKKRFVVRLEYNTELSHKIEAGADFFLMPSRFEPCGLNQLYSLRYGAIPIVHATGGLKDTIRNCCDETGNGIPDGNGFVFEQYSGEALYDTLQMALKKYADKTFRQDLMRRNMREEHSWDHAAQEYLDVYHKALAL